MAIVKNRHFQQISHQFFKIQPSQNGWNRRHRLEAFQGELQGGSRRDAPGWEATRTIALRTKSDGMNFGSKIGMNLCIYIYYIINKYIYICIYVHVEYDMKMCFIRILDDSSYSKIF